MQKFARDEQTPVKDWIGTGFPKSMIIPWARDVRVRKKVARAYSNNRIANPTQYERLMGVCGFFIIKISPLIDTPIIIHAAGLWQEGDLRRSFHVIPVNNRVLPEPHSPSCRPFIGIAYRRKPFMIISFFVFPVAAYVGYWMMDGLDRFLDGIKSL